MFKSKPESPISLVRIVCVMLTILGCTLLLSASTPVTVIYDDFNSFDTNTWIALFQRGPGVPGWDTSYGTVLLNSGTVELRANEHRGGTSLETVNPISISLPMTIRFRVRYQGGNYRHTHFRLVVFGSVDGRIVEWITGSTGNLFLFSDHRLTVSGQSIANMGPHLVSHDTWINAEMHLYKDRIETQFEGISMVGYVDMTPYIGTDIALRIGTFDDHSNQGQDVDFVEVTTAQQTPVEAIRELVTLVQSFNLQRGIENSLDAKLDTALQALEDMNQNNNIAAINSLQAFVNAVDAQRGNMLTNEQADALVRLAQQIIADLQSE